MDGAAEFVSKRFVLEGRVQGVGCRMQVQMMAENIGHLSGHVKNLTDGRVEVCVKGPDWRIEDFEKSLRERLRPPVYIDRILSEEWPSQDIAGGFRILRDENP